MRSRRLFLALPFAVALALEPAPRAVARLAAGESPLPLPSSAATTEAASATVVPPAASSPTTPRPALAAALATETANALRSASELGVHVVEVESGAPIYSYLADVPRVLASNTKLLTTAAALDAFGTGYLFETRLVSRGKIERGVLRGDLGVVGGGDPNISGRDWAGDSYGVFRAWARDLVTRGIRQIDGDLFLAAGLFAGAKVHPDWPRNQLGSWYEAPVDALSFNDNCILVRVHPGERAGDAAIIELVPNLPLLTISNSAKTKAGGRMQVAVDREGGVLRVTGSIPRGLSSFDTWITVPDPATYFGAAMIDALRQEGIAVRGEIHKVDRLPGPVWERISVYRSDLLTAVQVANKRSQNFYAESLVKLLGDYSCGDGSWRGGTRAVREFLRSVGVPLESVRLADGSGMSRANSMPAREVVRLLRHMWFHAAGPEFVRSLPYGGENMGSWRRRLATPPYQGNVFAKTGTLADVSALSGYARAASGKVYAFSILGNRAVNTNGARDAQDRIVRAIVDFG